LLNFVIMRNVFSPYFVVKFAVLLASHEGLKVILNSLVLFTSLPLGSPVVGAPSNLFTSVFYSISSVDDGTVARSVVADLVTDDDEKCFRQNL
jgi:hypothetical protein